MFVHNVTHSPKSYLHSPSENGWKWWQQILIQFTANKTIVQRPWHARETYYGNSAMKKMLLLYALLTGGHNRPTRMQVCIVVYNVQH